MKFFVTSHGREHTSTTPKLLEGLDWYFLLHRHQDADKYAAAGWPLDRIRVTNTIPGYYAQTAHRAIAYQTSLETGEWGVFMDDDVQEIRFHPTGEREHYELVKGERFGKIADDARKMSERLGFHLFGSSTPVTANRWSTVGKFKESYMGWQKTEKPFPLDIRVRNEEVFYACEHMARDGGIVLDSWLRVKNLKFSPGGLGPYEQRYREKVESSKFMCLRYPGMVELEYSTQVKDREKFPEMAALKLKIRTPKALQRWRRGRV